MRVKIINYLILILIIFCCKPNIDDDVDYKEIANKAISFYLKENKIPNQNYLVVPYYDAFQFDSYMIKNYELSSNKKEIFKKLKWDENIFSNIQKEVDYKYNNKYSKKLLDLSKSEKSNYVLTFSGVHENLLFMKVINLCEKVTREEIELNKDLSNKTKKGIYYLVILIDKGQVKEVVMDNFTLFELECNN